MVSASTPYEAPAGPLRFVDRQHELSALERILGPRPSVSITVLTGLEGVGKTATALRLTEKIHVRFGGGVLYVDYSQLRKGRAGDVSDALATCLRGLGVADQFMPASLHERGKLYRTLTSDRSLLVVLDDVTEPAQVLPLLPSAPGSAVLITSNNRLTELRLDGADLFSLKPLDSVQGLQLLASFCGEDRIAAESEAAAELVRFCGGLPVALRIAAARLVASTRLTITALVAELAEDSSGLNLSAVFSNSYGALPEAAKQLYQTLGLLPVQDFTAEQVALAGGYEPRRASTLLDTLVNASLLNEVGTDRYRFHDLVRKHAAERAEVEVRQDDVDAVLRRIVHYYLTTAAFTDPVLMGPNRLRITDLDVLLADQTNPFTGDTARDQAAAWLRAERANLLTVIRAAAHQHMYDQVWQLAEVLTGFYLNYRHLNDWIESSTLGAEAANAAANPAAEARLRSLVSRAHTDLGDLDRAGLELDTALPLAAQSGHPVLQASVWEFLGRYRDHADPSAAASAYRHSLELNLEAGERRGAALATYFLGCSLNAAGQPAEALATVSQAHKQLTAVGDTRMAGRATVSLGSIQAQLGQHTEAATSLADAVQTLTPWPHYRAQALVALADLAKNTGDHTAEREYLHQALEIHTAAGNPAALPLRARLDAN